MCTHGEIIAKSPQEQLDELLAQRVERTDDLMSTLERLLDVVTVIYNYHSRVENDDSGLWVICEEAYELAKMAMLRQWIALGDKVAQ